MKRLKHNFKKGMAFVLSLAMVAGLVPVMSGGANKVQAASGSGTEPSVSAYATKTQLMDNTFAPNADGTAENYGKIVFGKKSDGITAQEWNILGEDKGVSGDNTIIFATSPIATGQKFNSSYDNKSFASSFGVYASNPSEVYANHYGASELRVALQGMATNTNYFTTAEQGLMNATTVKTKDTKNSNVTYTTTDKLYALQGNNHGDKKLLAGTSDSTVLAVDIYWYGYSWSNDSVFWLRSPYADDANIASLGYTGSAVGERNVDNDFAVRPASNLNLSSVLFASAATAASSDQAKLGTIALDKAMTLRLDGTGKNIGTVTYSATTGDIKVVKGTTSQTVALVVQGNDGTNDWYYSKQITGTETINASDIKSALSLTSDIDLSACKIWLETTDSTSNLTYAVNATDIISITSVAITDIDIPVSNTALDTEASCTTEGVKSTTPQITWTPSDTTAGYNTRYTASITLTAATGYEFADNVTATVSGNTATSVTKNAADDTLTVTKEFTTDKRKIESVAAPTVPENNTFTAYYGYDGYDTTPISGTNTELGKTATVTFEGTTSPTTEDMAVTWTIESDGGVYDKTPEAENIFRWTIPESALTNYNAANCQGYDTSTGNITGTITVKNKAATPVAITGTDSSITYTGETVDVSQYFSIDNNAGAATYTLVTGTNGGTGKGTLSGTTLTVTQTGTFKIKVSTVANGIFAAGQKTVTLTGIGTYASYTNSYGNTQNAGNKTGRTYKNAHEYKNYLTQKYDCLRSRDYSVNINSSLLSKAMGDEKTKQWLEYNLSLIPKTIEQSRAYVAARGAKILSYSITINGYDSMSSVMCTQDEVDPGTEKARKELEERLEKRKAEKKETEERLEKQRAEKQEQKEQQYNLKIDGKDVADLTVKMVELVGASTSTGVTENGVSAFDVLA